MRLAAATGVCGYARAALRLLGRDASVLPPKLCFDGHPCVSEAGDGHGVGVGVGLVVAPEVAAVALALLGDETCCAGSAVQPDNASAAALAHTMRRRIT